MPLRHAEAQRPRVETRVGAPLLERVLGAALRGDASVASDAWGDGTRHIDIDEVDRAAEALEAGVRGNASEAEIQILVGALASVSSQLNADAVLDDIRKNVATGQSDGR